jgi:hypothetical protein
MIRESYGKAATDEEIWLVDDSHKDGNVETK